MLVCDMLAEVHAAQQRLFHHEAEDMALRPASLAGLSRRVMASRAVAPTRSGGGGPIALGKAASQPVITHFWEEWM